MQAQSDIRILRGIGACLLPVEYEGELILAFTRNL